MFVKKSIYFLFFIFFVSSHNLHAGYEAFEEDIEQSKIRPLISGKERKEIIENGQAFITVCTTPIKGYFGEEYDHVYLVFEIQHITNPEEIALFAVHFGGDGHSPIINEGCPIIDSRKETLIKVLRGKRIDYSNSTNSKCLKYTEVNKIYEKATTFPVTQKRARKALGKIIKDTDLRYDLFGGSMRGPNSYNCVTYADKVLQYCKIYTQFNSAHWSDTGYWIKNANYFLKCCDDFLNNQQQKVNGTENNDVAAQDTLSNTDNTICLDENLNVPSILQPLTSENFPTESQKGGEIPDYVYFIGSVIIMSLCIA
ncbi:MAG: hypothetical protein H0X26_07965 [Alphaproteobacteria bacterium]|nr:hypothetical protein [Alphaproteobacteria bacterium]